MVNSWVQYRHIGYRLDKEQKGKLIVDEYAADVVRKIFQMYADGNGSVDILNVLNRNNILPPSSYYRTKKKAATKWNQVTVLRDIKK